MENKVIAGIKDGILTDLWLRVNGVDHAIHGVGISGTVTLRSHTGVSIFEGSILVGGVKEIK